MENLEKLSVGKSEKGMISGMENVQENKRQSFLWINCAKLAAIFAVMTDHTNGILYTNSQVAWTSYFAVSLFIIISGITSYISNSRSALSWGKSYIKSIKKIFGAYLIASAICLIIKTHSFDILSYINCLIHFNASLPLYYVFLYLQIMLISRLLFYVLQLCPRNKKGYIQESILFLIIVGISILTTNHTQILDIYGGGGKVLGGTYLILFYFGMLVARHEWLSEENDGKSMLIWLVASGFWIIWWMNLVNIRNYVDSKVPFGYGFNPPSIAFMAFSIFTLFAIYGFCKILEKWDMTKNVVRICSWFGTHTLYIFMYHMILLYFFLMPYLNIENIWLKRIVYWGLMIAIPITWEFIVNICITKIKRILYIKRNIGN